MQWQQWVLVEIPLNTCGEIFTLLLGEGAFTHERPGAVYKRRSGAKLQLRGVVGDSGSESFESEAGETNLSLLLGPHHHNTEKLVTALLNVARRQHTILKQANLQTPEIDADLQALELLIAGERGVMDTTPTEKKQKSDVCEEDGGKSLKEGASWMPPMKDIFPEIKAEEPVVQAPTTRKRQPTKRSHQTLLPDTSPTLCSPVVPVKRRRQDTRTPSKSSPVLPSTPEVHAKRLRKSSIPSRPNLRSSSHLLSNKAPDLPGTGQSKLSFGTPKQLSQPLTKGRVPLGTSALQNSARLPAAALSVRDMNTTFDLSEDAWMTSEKGKPLTSGPSEFPGWENLGDSCVYNKGPLVVFVRFKYEVVLSEKETTYERLFRPRVGSGTISQSRIARLQLSTTKPMQRPPTIAGERGKHRVTKRGPALSYAMFTLVTSEDIAESVSHTPIQRCLRGVQRPNKVLDLYSPTSDITAGA
ncbi:unnamed protein product [Ranitomeya imitator]|uniref:Uncharacterized protein n=1 Tax=Ranitomeya imitator TaxID=111125 RepID=A0ABN9MDB5_9NEOB|nr:unnamed protein product [Ranitomeya imitator]